MDLLVKLPNVGHFLLNVLRAALVLVEKVRMVASCQLFTAFSARFLVRTFVDFGDAYVAVRTNCVRSFQVCRFPTLSLCVLHPFACKIRSQRAW